MVRQANLLFNAKTIKKLCQDIAITDKQRESAKEWLKLLEENKLEDEKKNYFRFGQIILQDILGYSVKEIDFESDNVEFQFTNSEGKKMLCFETKGTSTKDLFASQHRQKKEHETPIKQTWDYMGSIGLDYGICTNYRNFVLITKEIGYSKYHKFDFESIKSDEEKLKEFVGIFSRERLIEKGFAKKLYHESIIEEREFTKEFYKLFHETRLMLIKTFREKPDVTKEEAIHYAQLYLNRIIFMFFAEDNGLIYNRLFSEKILEILKSPLVSEHSRLVSDQNLNLFSALNKGSSILRIYGFNGGLFEETIPPKIYFTDLQDPKSFSDVKQNSALSMKLKLDDFSEKIIKKYSGQLNPIITNFLIMDSFDFTSEINVNILGHIFEQSINDLEEIRQEETSRRKKEGVYYTPEYITDYICRNTIIPYLSKNNFTTISELIKEYTGNIEELEERLKKIKILDPACGSGAFLVKAADILLGIDEEIQNQKYRASNFQITEFSEEKEITKIIQDNIFGVDINEESVEITKLSLFLKTAATNHKLTNLSNNIKVGNSIIDDPQIANKKAFDWKKEFPDIINNGGFSVIIGNPPYVDSENMTKYNKKERDFLAKTYKSTKGNWDLYIPFIEKAFNLINENGKISMITPNKWLSISYGSAIRDIIGKYLNQLSDYSNIKVFEDAGIFPIIFFLSKKVEPVLNVKVFSEENKFVESNIKKKVFEGFDNFGIFFSKYINLIIKILEDSKPLGTICDISGAFTTSEAYDLIPLIEDKETDDKQYLKFVNTGTIDSYFPLWGFQPTKYIKKEYHYPVVSRTKLENKFRKRYGRFNKHKIIISGIRHFECFYDKNNQYLAGKSTTVVTDIHGINYESINCILNSKLVTFYLKEGFSSSGMDGGINFSPAVISTIPIPNIKENIQDNLTKKSDMMFELWSTLYEKKNRFLKLIKHEYNIDQVSRKLDEFYKLGYDEFAKQFDIKLDMNQKAELLDFFEKNKKEVLEILEKISKTDAEINDTVYNLYRLTDEEIEMIEKNYSKRS